MGKARALQMGLRRMGVLAAIVLMSSGCAAGPVQDAAAQAAPAPQQAAAAGYALGSGDKLRITVFNEDRLTGEYSVTGAGDISYPLIGSVTAAGKTLEQVRDTIRDRLAAGYIKDPRVSVEVLNYRPFYILGEVAKPGEYPYVIGLTVQQAVATAGGYTYRANTRRVFVKGTLDTAEHQLNLRDSTPVSVRPGDTIRIGERYF